MHAVNTEVSHLWQLGAANTGLAGTMSAVAKYTVDGSAVVTSAVTVTIAEIAGSAGDYSVKYTPDVEGTWLLTATESTNLYTYAWETQVGAATASVSASNAFCSEADVIAIVQAGEYSATTSPTENEVLGFMQRRASELVSAMGHVMQDSVVYPATIDETTNAGATLGRHLRMANSVGAAMDAIEAGGFTETPARSERVSELAELYGVLLSQLEDPNGVSRLYLGYSGRTGTHLASGEVTTGTITSTEAPGVYITTKTDW